MVLSRIESTITSREIAKLSSKDHNDVLKSIRKMEAAWVKVNGGNFTRVEYKDKKGEKRPEFIFSKSQALYIASKYNDEIRALIINRLNYLETQLKERTEAKLEHPAMTKAIEESVKLRGKEPKFYNFSNEADMINRIVLGCSAAKWRKSHELSKEDNVRDTLTALQMQAVNHMQKNNTALIEMGFSFEDRKERLDALFNAKYSRGIIDEFNKLNG